MDDDTEPQRWETNATDERERGATGPSRGVGDDREHRSTSEPTGFVWCESEEPEPSDGGFEWGTAFDEPGATTTESSRRAADPEDPDRADEDDGLTLDPTLVTTTRGAGIDDEAVSLLAAFRDHCRRRDRNRGR